MPQKTVLFYSSKSITAYLIIIIINFIHLLKVGGVTGILNRQSGSCNVDDDCSSRETFLFCINKQCQCLLGGSTYVHGVLLQFNMIWDPYQSKCVSQPGSPCTLKNHWYPSSDTTKLECSQDSSCIPHSSSQETRHYDHPQYQYQQRQQQSRFQQQRDQSMTQSDFGVCWQNGQIQNVPGGESQSQPFYPILTPNKPQYPPNRHEFASSSNGNKYGYPISPTKLDNSATASSINRNGAVVFGIFITILFYI